jgi:outer membrane protein OmpA-like peptidoglycan-associated protein
MEEHHNNSWINIADVMAVLMMVFMFIAIAFLYQLQNEKEIYKVQLNKALHEEFDKDLIVWDAEITDDNIMRFNAPFQTGSDVIPKEFDTVLLEFFPRYVNLLSNEKFKKEIDEIRVEGHTSNGWGKSAQKESYLFNMNLSQRRASNVLAYCYNLNNQIISQNLNWLQKKLRANGMSFSNLLYQDDAKTIQDKNRSRRVEFKVVTKEHFD